MSLFGNLFSSEPSHPPIDPDSVAAKRIAEVEPQLKDLIGRVSGPLEIVPTDHAAYVFIGKPPKKFGLAWIHDGEISGLNTLVEEHGLKPLQIEHLLEKLRQAYERNAEAKHYSTSVGGKRVTVTASERLENEVHNIIEDILH